MNDEQRRLACFGAQPGGTGPVLRSAASRFAHVQQAHYAQRSLPCAKPASVAGMIYSQTGS